jgi:hypothetical protein
MEMKYTVIMRVVVEKDAKKSNIIKMAKRRAQKFGSTFGGQIYGRRGQLVFDFNSMNMNTEHLVDRIIEEKDRWLHGIPLRYMSNPDFYHKLIDEIAAFDGVVDINSCSCDSYFSNQAEVFTKIAPHLTDEELVTTINYYPSLTPFGFDPNAWTKLAADEAHHRGLTFKMPQGCWAYDDPQRLELIKYLEGKNGQR